MDSVWKYVGWGSLTATLLGVLAGLSDAPTMVRWLLWAGMAGMLAAGLRDVFVKHREFRQAEARAAETLNQLDAQDSG